MLPIAMRKMCRTVKLISINGTLTCNQENMQNVYCKKKRYYVYSFCKVTKYELECTY